MTPATIIIWAAFVPGAIALVAAFFTSRVAEPPRVGWLVALGVAGGYLAGQLGLVGWQAFDGDITHWLLVLALGGALVGVLEGFVDRASLRWFLRVLASSTAAWLLLRPLLPAQLWGLAVPSNVIAPLWWPGLTLAIFVLWSALDRLAIRDEGRLLSVLLILLVLSGGATLFFAGNATTAALSGPLAATLGGVFAVAMVRPRAAFLRPAVPAVAILLLGQWSIGRFYTDNFSLWSLGLLLGAPLLLALASPLLQRPRRLVAVILQLLVLGLPASVAAGIGAMGYFSPALTSPSSASPPAGASPATSRPQGDENYGY